MAERDKELIQRYSHGSAAVSVNSDCVELIFLGGRNKLAPLTADPVVLRFGKCIRVLDMEVIRMTVDYILLI